MERHSAHINPYMLVWARETSGLSVADVSKKVGVKPEKLAQWESGETTPTMNQLREIGRVYRRPSALFYSSAPPRAIPPVADYRLLPDHVTRESPRIFFEIRRAHERREIALDLSALSTTPVADFDVDGTLSEDPSALANRIRDSLGVSIDVQASWGGNEYLALRTWVSAVERLGVLVFQASGIDVEVMRGFSFAKRPLPVIVLNGSDSVRGRIFTLMHELTHVVLGDGGLCNLREGYGINSIEVLCNRVAGSILVPADALLHHPVVKQHNDVPEWQDADIKYLSNRFVVSREVVLRRLLILGRTSQEFYSAMREEYSKYTVTRKEADGGPKRHILILRDNGMAYTDMVIGAYRSDHITESLLSRYLGGINLPNSGSICLLSLTMIVRPVYPVSLHIIRLLFRKLHLTGSGLILTSSR